MTLKELWNSMNWRFLIWITAALLAYRTAPDAGFPVWVSVLTGLVYLALWVALLHLDAGEGARVSLLMRFMLVLMLLCVITMVATPLGVSVTLLSVFWLIPVGMPLQGLVRLFSDAASRSDAAMAAVSLGLLALLLVLRVIFYQKRQNGAKNG